MLNPYRPELSVSVAWPKRYQKWSNLILFWLFLIEDFTNVSLSLNNNNNNSNDSNNNDNDNNKTLNVHFLRYKLYYWLKMISAVSQDGTKIFRLLNVFFK